MTTMASSTWHRLICVVLAACVPAGLFLLEMSLQGEPGFEAVTSLFRHWTFKLLAVLVLGAFVHHVLSGLRHLLTDIAVDSPADSARRSAWLVTLGGAGVTLFALVAWL
jgi:succinate dehydrogenase / fumarate reductase, cytochrome b subunit